MKQRPPSPLSKLPNVPARQGYGLLALLGCALLGGVAGVVVAKLFAL